MNSGELSPHPRNWPYNFLPSAWGIFPHGHFFVFIFMRTPDISLGTLGRVGLCIRAVLGYFFRLLFPVLALAGIISYRFMADQFGPFDRYSRIHMDTDKQIALVFIGNLCPPVNRGDFFSGTGFHNPDLRHFCMKFFNQLFGHGQANLILIGISAPGPVVPAIGHDTMTGIHNDGFNDFLFF